MPETCENWLGLLNSCVYCAHPTCEIYQVLHYSVDLGSFEIHWVKQDLVNAVLFGIQDLETSEMTVKLKGNLLIGPENIFPNF